MLFMAALWNRAGHYIFALWFLLLLSFFFFFHRMCCARLAGNAGPKKSPKNRHLGTIAQICRAVSLQLRHVSTIGKNLSSSNTSSICPRCILNFGPLTAEIGSGGWDTPANFNGFASWQHYCTSSSSGRQPNVAALNRGRHLCSAGRPSGWALAHILVVLCITVCCMHA